MTQEPTKKQKRRSFTDEFKAGALGLAPPPRPKPFAWEATAPPQLALSLSLSAPQAPRTLPALGGALPNVVGRLTLTRAPRLRRARRTRHSPPHPVRRGLRLLSLLFLFTIEVLVLDEADRMLDMGFKPQLTQILKRLPTARQSLLFSATMAGEVADFARS